MREDTTQSYPPIGAISGTVVVDEIMEEEASIRHETPRSMWPQRLATLAASMSGMMAGMAIGWSGPALPLLRSNLTNPEFELSYEQSNWAASLMPLGALIGGPVGGLLIDKFGGRTTMMMNAANFAMGFLMLAAAGNAFMILLGRYWCGLGTGISTISAPVYISETVSSQVRGMLGFCFQLMLTIGILYIYLVGNFHMWRWISVAAIFVTLIGASLLFFVPESPVFLLKMEEYSGARESLEFLRGHPYIESELQEIQNGIDEAKRTNASAKDLLKPHHLKPLAVSLLLMIGQQFSGVNAIIFFSVQIFAAANSNLGSFVESVIVALTMVVMTFISAGVVDRLGRRIMLNGSAVTMAVSSYFIGSYFWLQVHDPSTAAKITFVPLLSLCVFISAFSMGFGPIPWLMMSELFAPEVKGLAGSISGSFNWFLAFLVTRFFGPLSDEIGKAETFWTFSTILLVVWILCFIFVPETKGKSLEEIQRLFRSSKRLREDRAELIIDDDFVVNDDEVENQDEEEVLT